MTLSVVIQVEISVGASQSQFILMCYQVQVQYCFHTFACPLLPNSRASTWHHPCYAFPITRVLTAAVVYVYAVVLGWKDFCRNDDSPSRLVLLGRCLQILRVFVTFYGF